MKLCETINIGGIIRPNQLKKLTITKHYRAAHIKLKSKNKIFSHEWKLNMNKQYN